MDVVVSEEFTLVHLPENDISLQNYRKLFLKLLQNSYSTWQKVRFLGYLKSMFSRLQELITRAENVCFANILHQPKVHYFAGYSCKPLHVDVNKKF